MPSASSELEHALEPRFERMHAHQRHHARDEPCRIAVDVVDVRNGRKNRASSSADHRDRNIAEARVLRQQVKEGLHLARRKSVAETTPSMSRESRSLAAASTLSAPTILTRSPMATLSAGIKRAAAGDQHRGVIQRVVNRQWRRRPPAREEFHAAQHGRMQRANPHAPIAGERSAVRRQRGRQRKRDAGTSWVSLSATTARSADSVLLSAVKAFRRRIDPPARPDRR